MKKLLTLLLILAMSLTMFTGCSDDSGSATGGEDTFKIGIIQMMEHPSLNTIRESIIEGLEEEGYVDGENIEIIYQNGQNDMTTMQNIAQTFVGEECDVIVAIATNAAQASLAETTDIPIIFAAITDPVGAGLVDSLEAPGGNVTGTSDEVSASDIMDLAQEITPGFHTIGALYNLGEPNSVSVINDLKEYAQANGFEVIESTVTNTSEVQQAAQYLADRADIVFSPYRQYGSIFNGSGYGYFQQRRRAILCERRFNGDRRRSCHIRDRLHSAGQRDCCHDSRCA